MTNAVGGSRGIYLTVYNGSGSLIPQGRSVRLDSTTTAELTRSTSAGDPSDVEKIASVQLSGFYSLATETPLGVTMEPIPNGQIGQICLLGVVRVQVETAIVPGQLAYLNDAGSNTTDGMFDDAVIGTALGVFVGNEITYDTSAYQDFVTNAGAATDRIYAWAFINFLAVQQIAAAA